MRDRLPIGVVMPTLNCRARLEQHLAAMQGWAEQVEEIVVVDSFSEDGSLEWLKERLRLPHVRFLNHPRGLYPSWNFGLAQLHSAHAYISTVGDAITPEGLRHLFRVMRETRAAEIGFGERMALDHRAHGAVEDEDALGKERVESR